ncbi:mannose-6-phosphate isomerase, class I [Gemella bergeri ATCC 700627]|uniref:Mannose-6-phosphate isomerase n=1 Tax=Gemella bergeri ATCC 700627 TaxID=1321820 RepID=U2QIW5_9BACL|nr:mannose-6-phosphate isomerase, class I [Gemella bergeri]ERK56416.1 mannose-6-phosphate isomerase, class I [Gemella bergeri ATCC 700627]
MDKILFLKPVLCERLWGGRNLEQFGYNLPAGKIGEAWVIAAHDNGSSLIINGKYSGKTLKEAYKEDYKLFTQKQYEKFPLLIKILDASDELSVQVHPDDNYAKKYENGELGKTECWYVLDAEKNSQLIYGHTAKNHEEFNKKIDNKEWDKLFVKENVKKGDFFYIPAGTLHAIGGGILIYEVQQNSDTTYRVYDYDRVDKNGNKRELHIEKTKATTTVPFKKIVPDYTKTIKEDAIITNLAQERYFGVYKIELDGKTELEKNKTGNLFTVLNGAGVIKIDGQTFSLKKGDSFILTTACSNYELVGEMFLIGSYDRA